MKTSNKVTIFQQWNLRTWEYDALADKEFKIAVTEKCSELQANQGGQYKDLRKLLNRGTLTK